MRKKFFWLAAAIFALVGPALLAQDCSIQGITGTYAFRHTGESFLSPNLPSAPNITPSAAELPTHAAGLYSYGVIVGIMTIQPDSSVDIRYWSTIGSWSSMRAGVKMTGTITNLGMDKTESGVELGCAGTIEYRPFPQFPAHREKFFVLENGREIRGIPFETPAFPTLASLSTAHRITRAPSTAPVCGPQTARGTMVLNCPGPLFNPTGEIKTVGSASVIHLRMFDNGELTGTLHNRSANQFTSTELRGGAVVNPDCTGEAWFAAPDFVPGAVLKSMFVFFDGGQEGFALPLELFYSDSDTTIPYPPVSCDIKRVTP